MCGYGRGFRLERKRKREVFVIGGRGSCEEDLEGLIVGVGVELGAWWLGM